jgi:NADH-quinone oxidoreductase subunit J
MTAVFYISSAVALLATMLVITRRAAVHALLYLIVSLLAVALVFLSLGAPFVAALQVIIYAGAIMVLFVFAAMMLNLGHRASREESRLLTPGVWAGPAALAAVLLAELLCVFLRADSPGAVAGVVEAKAVGVCVFGPYLLGVELASMLLLAGLVGAYHLVRRGPDPGGSL